MEKLDLVRMLAFLCCSLCASLGGVPNLLYFNWPGIGVVALFTALAYFFPASALWLAFLGVMGGWVCVFRVRAKEHRLL